MKESFAGRVFQYSWSHFLNYCFKISKIKREYIQHGACNNKLQNFGLQLLIHYYKPELEFFHNHHSDTFYCFMRMMY